MDKMNDDLTFQQERIRGMAQSLADALEYLTEHAARANAAHESMEAASKRLDGAAAAFSVETKRASRLVEEVVADTPNRIAEAVVNLSSKASQEAVAGVTSGLNAATGSALAAANQLERWARGERITLFFMAGVGGMIGGVLGVLLLRLFGFAG
jgi:hypothetical protein